MMLHDAKARAAASARMVEITAQMKGKGIKG